MFNRLPSKKRVALPKKIICRNNVNSENMTGCNLNAAPFPFDVVY